MSDGFDLTGIRGAATELPAGRITRFGVLAIDGNQNNDRLRLHRFRITGTPKPEGAPDAKRVQQPAASSDAKATQKADKPN